MQESPLARDIIFQWGPVPISRAVLTTWGIMAVLVALSWLGMHHRRLRAGAAQAALETVVETLELQIRSVLGQQAWRYLPLLGTLFIFLAFANLSAVVPGTKPPTGHVETPAALAGIVFLSVHYYGIRSRGLRDYLRRYLKPNPLLLPLNIVSELTRTFSLMVRLFGNIMSHELMLAIVLYLAGLLLPIPFMLLGILIGIIQAYIFTVLAAVFIGAAVGSVEAG